MGESQAFPSQGKAWGFRSQGIRLITISVNYITRNAFPNQVNCRAWLENVNVNEKVSHALMKF